MRKRWITVLLICAMVLANSSLSMASENVGGGNEDNKVVSEQIQEVSEDTQTDDLQQDQGISDDENKNAWGEQTPGGENGDQNQNENAGNDNLTDKGGGDEDKELGDEVGEDLTDEDEDLDSETGEDLVKDGEEINEDQKKVEDDKVLEGDKETVDAGTLEESGAGVSVTASYENDAFEREVLLEICNPSDTEGDKTLIEAALGGKKLASGFYGFDISFVATGEDGEKDESVQPEGSVVVTVTFDTPVTGTSEENTDTEWKLFHIENGGADEISAEISKNDENAVTAVSFASGSFSPFYLAEVMTEEEEAEETKELITLKKVCGDVAVKATFAKDAFEKEVKLVLEEVAEEQAKEDQEKIEETIGDGDTDIVKMRGIDISFVTVGEDGAEEKVEPDPEKGTIKVEMEFFNPVQIVSEEKEKNPKEETASDKKEADWMLFHVKNDGEVENLTDKDETTITTITDNAVKAVDFEVESFSYFYIVGGASKEENDSLKDLITALGNGQSVKLMGDIEIPADIPDWVDYIEVKAKDGSNPSLDLNGHKLTFESGRTSVVFAVKDGATFTVKSSDGTGLIENAGKTIFEVNNSSLNLENIVIDHSAEMPIKSEGDKETTITVTSCKFVSNYSSSEGGAICNTNKNAELTIQKSKFEDNTANGKGGAIYTNGKKLTIKNTELVGNKALGNETNGGAVCVSVDSNAPQVELDTVTFTGNEASGNGGAVSFANVQEGSGVTAKIIDTNFKGNTSGSNGGAIYCGYHSIVTIEGNSIFESNRATEKGGAIRAGYAELMIKKNETGYIPQIISNQAKDGGGIYVDGGNNLSGGKNSITISDALIDKNTATNEGGGIYAYQYVKLHVTDGTISNNKAYAIEDPKIPEAERNLYGKGGGGIFVGEKAEFKLSGEAQITGNYSAGSGGGILVKFNQGNDSGKFIMTGGTVSGNTAESSEGGGIAICSGNNNKIIGGKIAGNKTNSTQHWGGGGIFISDHAMLYMEKVLVTENSAGGFGGGVAGCSTGRLFLTDDPGKGFAIYSNNAEGKHLTGPATEKPFDHMFAENNATFLNNGYQDYFSALCGAVALKMFNGENAGWTGSVDGMSVENYLKNHSSATEMVSSSLMGLTANPANKPGESDASVIVTGNSAYTHGGGILCNGTLLIGKSDPLKIGDQLEVKTSKELLNGETKAQVTLKDGEFQFELKSKDGKDIIRGKNNSNGEVAFDRLLSFNETGTYEYYLKEIGSTPKVKNDTKEYKIVVTVEAQSSETVQIDDIKTTKVVYKITDIKVSVKNGAVGSFEEYADIESGLGDEASAAHIKIGNVKAAFTNLFVPDKPKPDPTPEKPDPTPGGTDPEPTPDETPAPTATPTASASPSPSASTSPVPGATPTPGGGNGDNGGDTPGSTPTPETDNPQGIEPLQDNQVLGAARIRATGRDAAVLGARRGLDFAVLGKRRRPATGDSIALLLWVLSFGTAAGVAVTAVIMLNTKRSN